MGTRLRPVCPASSGRQRISNRFEISFVRESPALFLLVLTTAALAGDGRRPLASLSVLRALLSVCGPPIGDTNTSERVDTRRCLRPPSSPPGAFCHLCADSFLLVHPLRFSGCSSFRNSSNSSVFRSLRPLCQSSQRTRPQWLRASTLLFSTCEASTSWEASARRRKCRFSSAPARNAAWKCWADWIVRSPRRRFRSTATRRS